MLLSMSLSRDLPREFSGSSVLGLCALIVKGEGSFPDQGTEILQATWHSSLSPPKKDLLIF